MDLNLGSVVQLISNNILSLLRWGRRQYVIVAAKAEHACFEQLAAWMKEGSIRAVIDSTFEFNATPKAFEKLKSGRARGKVVVQVKES